jgi:hypothetical protein
MTGRVTSEPESYLGADVVLGLFLTLLDFGEKPFETGRRSRRGASYDGSPPRLMAISDRVDGLSIPATLSPALSRAMRPPWFDSYCCQYRRPYSRFGRYRDRS